MTSLQQGIAVPVEVELEATEADAKQPQTTPETLGTMNADGMQTTQAIAAPTTTPISLPTTCAANVEVEAQTHQLNASTLLLLTLETLEAMIAAGMTAIQAPVDTMMILTSLLPICAAHAMVAHLSSSLETVAKLISLSIMLPASALNSSGMTTMEIL